MKALEIQQCQTYSHLVFRRDVLSPWSLKAAK